MNDQQLRALQTPFKDRYRNDPGSALVTMKVTGDLDLDQVACRIATGRGSVINAGLHPMAGGDGSFACSAEMLLEALVGCAGTTACAVATAMNIPIKSGTVEAAGDLDFRGTLGVSREVPVGFLAVRMTISVDSEATSDQLNKLGQLVERYCVVAQSLSESARPKVTCVRVND